VRVTKIAVSGNCVLGMGAIGTTMPKRHSHVDVCALACLCFGRVYPAVIVMTILFSPKGGTIRT